jgi:hypothetical protein
VAVKMPVAYSQLMRSEKGITIGAAVLVATQTLTFGVDFPSDWEYPSEAPVDGVVRIVVPPLKQLSEIKIESSNPYEQMCNTPNVQQLVTMQQSFKRLAKEEFEKKVAEMLREDSDIYELSRASIERHYIGVLNQANPGIPVRSVKVRFQDEPELKKASLPTPNPA